MSAEGPPRSANSAPRGGGAAAEVTNEAASGGDHASSVASTVEVRHNAAANRFEAMVEGQLCVASYRLVDRVMRIHHTEVPASLEGRGIAARIVRAALAYADANDLKVEPWCGYVRTYMRRHPETQRLLPEDFPGLR